MAYYDTYRDQLASLDHGHALWDPDPAGLYDRVRVGDVGFVRKGHFFCMFNAFLPADHSTQVYGVPEGFVPLNTTSRNRMRNLSRGIYRSNTVKVENEERGAAGPAANGSMSTLFKCSGRNQGAFLYLPFPGNKADAVRTKAYETYIRKHCDSWIEFAIGNDFDVRLEDIILVTGCDLTSSWAMATFVDPLDLKIHLRVQGFENGSATFQWSDSTQPHNNESRQNSERKHCVFIRGFRVKRILPLFRRLHAAAEPRPDDSDNDPESLTELARQPAVPEYRDPLIGILDFIAEQCPDQEIAIAHEDDLKLIKGVDVLTADAVEKYLRHNNIPVTIEHGAALLAGENQVIPEDQKVKSLAQADTSVRVPSHLLANLRLTVTHLRGQPAPLIVHPVLTEYLAKRDITSQPRDYDFERCAEDLLSSALHSPALTLTLGHKQGFPPNIEVQTLDKGSAVAVSFKDMLKSVAAKLRLSSSYRKWSGLDDDRRREVEATFEDRAITDNEKCGGICHIDYLGGGNRPQIFTQAPTF